MARTKKQRRGVPLLKIIQNNPDKAISVVYKTPKRGAVLWAMVQGSDRIIRTTTRRGDPLSV